MLKGVRARTCGWMQIKSEEQYYVFFGFLPNASKQELTAMLWYLQPHFYNFSLYVTALYTVSELRDFIIKFVYVKPNSFLDMSEQPTLLSLLRCHTNTSLNTSLTSSLIFHTSIINWRSFSLNTDNSFWFDRLMLLYSFCSCVDVLTWSGRWCSPLMFQK